MPSFVSQLFFVSPLVFISMPLIVYLTVVSDKKSLKFFYRVCVLFEGLRFVLQFTANAHRIARP